MSDAIPEGRATVLFVDDDASTRTMYREYFEQEAAVTPVTAPSVATAREQLTRQDVDCVVSDGLYTAAGDLFVESVSRSHPDLPVILCSGSPPADLESLAVDDAVRKASGVTLSRLEASIAESLSTTGRSPDAAEPGTRSEREARSEPETHSETGPRTEPSTEAATASEAATTSEAATPAVGRAQQEPQSRSGATTRPDTATADRSGGIGDRELGKLHWPGYTKGCWGQPGVPKCLLCRVRYAWWHLKQLR